MKEHWIVGQVMATKDLSFFKLHDDNRKINPARVRRVKNSIRENGLLDPIKVSSDGTILNGQHRFIAIKELAEEGIYEPVKYIIVQDEATVQTIISLNAVQKELTLGDYIEIYAKNGQEQYQRIINIARKVNLTPSAVISVMFTGGSNSAFTQIVKYGQDLPFEEWELLEEYFDWIDGLVKYIHMTQKTRQMLYRLYEYHAFYPRIFEEKIAKEYYALGDKVRFSQLQNVCKKQLIDLYNKGSHKGSKNYIKYVMDAAGRVLLPE